MTYFKKIIKSLAYIILIILVSLCIYTFITTDVMKKEYVNVFGHTYFVVKTGSMSGTLEVNDIIIVRVTDKVKKGDIITYISKDGSIITHRLINIVGDKLISRGDVNNVEDEPITRDKVIGVVKLSFAPSLIFKLLALFIIVFIAFALINFESIMNKFIVNDKKISRKNTVPKDIFSKKVVSEESMGNTVVIPIDEIRKIQEEHEKKISFEDEIEVLEFEEVIDIDKNNIITKEIYSFKEREKDLLEQVSNLLRIKNNALTTTRINKKWLIKYQYVYKLAHIVSCGDTLELLENISHPTFKEIYDYDLDKVGLFENLRNKIYEMPIYVFLRILMFSILYNDEEFFDGVFKIMKYKIQIDKNSCFKVIDKEDTYAKKQIKSLINFMEKISLSYDNKNVFELEKQKKK